MPLNSMHAGLFAIKFKGYYYWELRAPFGWTLAPFSCCRLTSIIQQYCAAKGHNIVIYVDDFLVLGQSIEAALNSQKFLINLLLLLGLKDKPSKCTIPSQSVLFISFTFHFPSLSISISTEQALEILELVDNAL